MVFLSPFWLLALLPWAGLTAWLMRGRRRRVKVPFLDLWRGPVPLEVPKRGLHLPRAWVVLVIVALLLAVLGAAKPVVRAGRLGGGHSINIIVDRGITMSAMEAGVPRFAAVARRAAREISPRVSPLTEVQIVPIPGETHQSTARDWSGEIDKLSPTAMDTGAALMVTVREQLDARNGPILVITDQPIGVPDGRVVRVGPTQLPQDVGIVHLAASLAPTAQVMVRLRNESAQSQAQIRVTSGTQAVEQSVQLPASGQEQDYFFDVERLDATVQAELVGKDDQPANDRAWLVREGSNPRIEIRAPVSPELRRMVDVYSKARPPGSEPAVVAIVGSLADLTSDQPSIVVASATSPSTVNTQPVVVDHPINSQVNWRSLSNEVRVSSDAPAGWEPIVSLDGKTLVSVKGEPARRVWVGFDSQQWAGTTDFVVFWANVLSWVGAGGQEQYVAHPLTDFQEDWVLIDPPPISPKPAAGQWPGIYQGHDGARYALNAPPARYAAVPEAVALGKLLEQYSTASQSVQIAPILLLLAVACVAAACLAWRDSSGTARRSLFPLKA